MDISNVIICVASMLGMRFLLIHYPKLGKVIAGACVIIIIVALILSGYFLNFLGKAAIIAIVILILSYLLKIADLPAFIHLSPTLKKIFHKYFEKGHESSSSLLTMTEEEARNILGVNETASIDEIKAAYYQLTKKIHPDQGDSDVLAAQVNRAKDILLQEK